MDTTRTATVLRQEAQHKKVKKKSFKSNDRLVALIAGNVYDKCYEEMKIEASYGRLKLKTSTYNIKSIILREVRWIQIDKNVNLLLEHGDEEIYKAIFPALRKMFKKHQFRASYKEYTSPSYTDSFFISVKEFLKEEIPVLVKAHERDYLIVKW